MMERLIRYNFKIDKPKACACTLGFQTNRVTLDSSGFPSAIFLSRFQSSGRKSIPLFLNRTRVILALRLGAVSWLFGDAVSKTTSIPFAPASSILDQSE